MTMLLSLQLTIFTLKSRKERASLRLLDSVNNKLRNMKEHKIKWTHIIYKEAIYHN